MTKGRFVAAAALAVLLLAAVAGPEWQVEPVTVCRAGVSVAPKITSDGDQVYFLSTCDLVRENGDQSYEIFRWSGGSVTQLTHQSFCQIFDLAPSPDGGRVAFLSNCPHRGQNQSGNIELMLLDRKGEVTVLTRSPNREVKQIAWSADGRFIYFSSTADYAGDNSDGSQEIFSIDTRATPPVTAQVTRTMRPAGCAWPAAVPGAVLALCDEDFLETALPGSDRGLPVAVGGRKPGGNPDKNHELFSFSLEGKITQLTRTTDCENRPAAADAHGRVVAFLSECNLADPKKPGAGAALWLYSGGKFTRPLPSVFELRDLAVSPSGSSIVFVAALATDRQNLQHNPEAFILRLNELKAPRPGSGGFPAGLHLVSDFPAGAVRSPSASADGRTVVFCGNGNLNRSNPDGGMEVFIARPGARRPDLAPDAEPEDGDTVEPDRDEPEVEPGDTVESGDTVDQDAEPEEPPPPSRSDDDLISPGMLP